MFQASGWQSEADFGLSRMAGAFVPHFFVQGRNPHLGYDHTATVPKGKKTVEHTHK